MSFLNKIPVFEHVSSKSRDYIFYAITKDYQAEKLDKDIYVRLSKDSDSLYFGTKSELFSNPSSVEVGFKEGLWQHEVSEIFIYNEGGTDYQEFNVSPSGKFWGMNFSEYRVQTTPIEGLSYFLEHSVFYLKIPLKQLKVPLDSESCLIQIAGVLKDKNQNTILYSSCPLKNQKPDFHKKECGVRVQLL